MPPPQQTNAGLARYEPLFPLVIVAAGLVAFHNSFAGAFLFDDDSHIVKNIALRDESWAWRGLLTAARPLVELSLKANYRLGGLDPLGYHAFNLAVHLLAALTLYGLIRRTLLLPQYREEFGASASWLALTGSLLWAVHPLQTESVTYVVQRSQAMGGLFYLLTLYALLRGATADRRRWGWYACAVAACFLGMMSKEDTVTAPLVALLYDRVFLARSWREVARQRWALHLALAATWLVVARRVLVVLGVDLNPGTPGVENSAGLALQTVTPLQYARSQPAVIFHYMQLAVWPSPLCLDFGWEPAHSAAEIVPAAVGIIGLLGLTVWALYHHPGLGFVGAAFFLILGPTSSILPIADLMVEHRMYLPLAALTILAALGGFASLRWAERRWAVKAATGRLFAGIGVAAAVLSLCVVTVARNEDYYSELSMWRLVAEQRPDNVRARYNLASVLFKIDDPAVLPDVISECQAALRIDPEYARAHSLLGRALIRTGNFQAGVVHVAKAVALAPMDPSLRYPLAKTYLDAGKLEEAAEQFREALRLSPRLAEAENGLGLVVAQQGNDAEAVKHFRTAVLVRPEYAEAHTNLAITLRNLKRFDEAVRHHDITVRLKPGSVEGYSQFGLTLMCAGRPRDAVECFREAVRLSPDRSRFHRELAGALYEAGDRAGAEAEYRVATQSAPDWVATTNKTAWGMATSNKPGLRDRQLAIVLAKQVCQVTGFKEAKYLDTLAAAYAGAGDFRLAAATAAEAVKRAEAQPELATAIRGRAALYEKGQAFSE